MESYKRELVNAYGTYADQFEKRFETIFQEVAEPFYVRFVNELPGENVLDFGSGSGSIAVRLKNSGHSVLCLDLSPVMIQKCREKGLDSVLGDMEQIEFPPERFSGIWAYCSLIHLKKHAMPVLVERFSKWLEPNGIVGITLLDEGRPDELREDKSCPGVKRWFSYYTQEQALPYFSTHFDVIFLEKTEAKRSNGNTFYYLNFLLKKK